MDDPYKPLEPLFAQVVIKGTLYVPEADYGDEYTVVMRGKVTKLSGGVTKGEIKETWTVTAENVMELDIDPNAVLDASNADLQAQLVDFLSAQDVAEADEPPSPVVVSQLDGQESLDVGGDVGEEAE